VLIAPERAAAAPASAVLIAPERAAATSRAGTWSLLRLPLAAMLVARTLTLALIAVWPHPLPVQQRLTAYDGGWYALIAESGYPATLPESGQQGPLAFFPAWPLLLRGLSTATGFELAYAGALLGLGVGLLAVAGVTLVAAEVLPRRQAVCVGVLWSVLPPAYVLSMSYSEPLFVAASSFALLWCLRGQWLAAGAAAGLACVTRPTGSAVVLALGVAAAATTVRSRDGRPLLGVAVAAVLPAAWLLFLARRTGAVTAWFAAQEAGWPGSPFDAVRAGGYALLHPAREPWYTAVACLLGLGALVLALLVRAALRRPGSVPMPLLVYVLGLFGLVLAAGAATYSSTPRVLWTAFPLLFPLAPWLASGRVRLLTASAISAVAMLLLAAAVVTGSGAVVP
jgi:hypothetical protein